MALICTEETYKDVKKVRSDLNKEYQELEKRRKEVKAQILKPYEQFETVYRECAGDLYANADKQLQFKIAEVENGLKAQKAEALEKYFDEYRESVGIASDFVTIEDAGIRVGLSDSLTSLKKKAKEFLDRIRSDLDAMNGLEYQDEVLVEYRKSFNLSQAMTTVDNRNKLIAAEAERRRAEAERQAAQRDAEQAVRRVVMEERETVPEAIPIPEEEREPAAQPVSQQEHVPEADEPGWIPPEPDRYSTAFKVTGSLAQLKALKAFLTEGGYEYESILI